MCFTAGLPVNHFKFSLRWCGARMVPGFRDAYLLEHADEWMFPDDFVGVMGEAGGISQQKRHNVNVDNRRMSRLNSHCSMARDGALMLAK